MIKYTAKCYRGEVLSLVILATSMQYGFFYYLQR